MKDGYIVFKVNEEIGILKVYSSSLDYFSIRIKGEQEIYKNVKNLNNLCSEINFYLYKGQIKFFKNVCIKDDLMFFHQLPDEIDTLYQERLNLYRLARNSSNFNHEFLKISYLDYGVTKWNNEEYFYIVGIMKEAITNAEIYFATKPIQVKELFNFFELN